MIGLNLDIFFLLYLGVGFLLLFVIWFYYDWIDGRKYYNSRSKVTYHCIKCSQIYTGPNQGEEFDCPECGFSNGRLQF